MSKSKTPKSVSPVRACVAWLGEFSRAKTRATRRAMIRALLAECSEMGRDVSRLPFSWAQAEDMMMGALDSMPADVAVMVWRQTMPMILGQVPAGVLPARALLAFARIEESLTARAAKEARARAPKRPKRRKAA